jgi:hypothetical protein
MAVVRVPIASILVPERPNGIFNLAAVYRKAGHEPHEFFYTNLAGARNVCAFASDSFIAAWATAPGVKYILMFLCQVARRTPQRLAGAV